MTALIIIGILLMLVGLIGTVAPFLPGVPVTWVGMFLFALGTHFSSVSKTATLIFFILMLLSVASEFLLPVIGGKAYKASTPGLIGAMIGLFVGPVIFNILGIIIGPLVGAVIGEYIAGKREDVFRAGWGVFVGFMLSMVLKLVLAFIMVGYVVFATLL